MKQFICTILLVWVSLMSFQASAQSTPGPGPFDYPNCYIRYTYDNAGLRKQRYQYCPPCGNCEKPANNVDTAQPPVAGASITTQALAVNKDSMAAVQSKGNSPTSSQVPEIKLLQYYPNPAKTLVTVELSEEARHQVMVVDMQGRTVKRGGTAEGRKFVVSVEGLPNGQYMIILESTAGRLGLPITVLQ